MSAYGAGRVGGSMNPAEIDQARQSIAASGLDTVVDPVNIDQALRDALNDLPSNLAPTSTMPAAITQIVIPLNVYLHAKAGTPVTNCLRDLYSFELNIKDMFRNTTNVFGDVAVFYYVANVHADLLFDHDAFTLLKQGYRGSVMQRERMNRFLRAFHVEGDNYVLNAPIFNGNGLDMNIENPGPLSIKSMDASLNVMFIPFVVFDRSRNDEGAWYQKPDYTLRATNRNVSESFSMRDLTNPLCTVGQLTPADVQKLLPLGAITNPNVSGYLKQFFEWLWRDDGPSPGGGCYNYNDKLDKLIELQADALTELYKISLLMADAFTELKGPERGDKRPPPPPPPPLKKPTPPPPYDDTGDSFKSKASVRWAYENEMIKQALQGIVAKNTKWKAVIDAVVKAADGSSFGSSVIEPKGKTNQTRIDKWTDTLSSPPATLSSLFMSIAMYNNGAALFDSDYNLKSNKYPVVDIASQLNADGAARNNIVKACRELVKVVVDAVRAAETEKSYTPHLTALIECCATIQRSLGAAREKSIYGDGAAVFLAYYIICVSHVANNGVFVSGSEAISSTQYILNAFDITMIEAFGISLGDEFAS